MQPIHILTQFCVADILAQYLLPFELESLMQTCHELKNAYKRFYRVDYKPFDMQHVFTHVNYKNPYVRHVNNMPHGITSLKNENMSEVILPFKNGVVHGPVQEFVNDILMNYGMYRNGVRHGRSWTISMENTLLRCEYIFKNGSRKRFMILVDGLLQSDYTYTIDDCGIERDDTMTFAIGRIVKCHYRDGKMKNFKKFMGINMSDSKIAWDLTFLGKMYHTHFGFKRDQASNPGKTSLMMPFRRNNSPVFDLFLDAFECGMCIYIGDNCVNTNLIKEFQDLIDDETYTIVFDLEYIEKWADQPLLFKTIIVKHPGRAQQYWGEKLIQYFNSTTPWYNRPSDWFKHTHKSLWSPNNVLPYLNTQPFITVEEPFMRVRIDGTNNLLTLNHVLFATRALALDETRGYDKFNVESIENGVLTLTVEMDNWSS